MPEKTGRKNAYDTIIYPNLEKIKFWLNEGYSNQQVIKMLGVSEATFYKYSTIKPEFKDILENNRQQLEIKLTDALYKESIGFFHTETHIEIEEDILVENEKEKILKRKKKQRKITRFNRGNTQALIFALCNNYPDKWRRVDKEIIKALEENNILDNKLLDGKLLKKAVDLINKNNRPQE
jgi:hypothetical protein